LWLVAVAVALVTSLRSSLAPADLVAVAEFTKQPGCPPLRQLPLSSVKVAGAETPHQPTLELQGFRVKPQELATLLPAVVVAADARL
jgi:hypothetical protein